MTDVNLTYSVGTVSVGVGDTTVVGVGGLWSQSTNVRQWDLISIDNGPLVPIIASAADDTHVTIPAWTGAAKAAVTYVIYQISPLRFVGGQAMADVDNMLANLNTDGWYRYVNPAFADPTAAKLTANEGQFALKYSTRQVWIMTGGVWVFVQYLGQTYGGSSVTSFAIGTGSKAFTTDPALAYLPGNYIRASSAASGANFMEGFVTSYAAGILTLNIVRVGGTGTHVDWNFSISGAPGIGDVVAANNGSDFADVDVTLDTLHGVSFVAQSLSTAQKLQARTNIDVPNTYTALLSGSGTYTPPTGCKYYFIRRRGGGGGGAAGMIGGNPGGNGGSTTVGSSIAGGGFGGGSYGNAGATGGNAGGGNILNLSGSSSAPSFGAGGGSPTIAQGNCGAGEGCGMGGWPGTNGFNAGINSGAGGGGGGGTTGGGNGGSQGGYVESFGVAVPFSYAVGAGGPGGVAGGGGYAGGAGGAGWIVVEEIY